MVAAAIELESRSNSIEQTGRKILRERRRTHMSMASESIDARAIGQPSESVGIDDLLRNLSSLAIGRCLHVMRQ